jgi:hypothetical protein
LNAESKVVINTENESEEYELVWKSGVMASEADGKALTA